MKSMGGITFLKGGSRNTAFPLSVTVSFLLFVLLVHSIKFSNTFKTMSSVKKLKHSGSHKVSSVWTPDHASIKKAESLLLSAGACQTAASSSSSSSSSATKCRKEKKQKHKVHKGLNKVRDSSSKNAAFPSDKFASRTISSLAATLSPPEVPKFLNDLTTLTPENIHEVNKFIRKKRHYCKLHQFASFTCKKLKWSLWLAKQMDKNVTRLAPWAEIVRNSDSEPNATGKAFLKEGKDLRDIKPTYWPEKIVYRLIKAWGDPEDLFVFYKYKDYVNSRELKISLPYKAELKVAPKSVTELEADARAKKASLPATSALAQETTRFFWDPGFNLKLKLPFFRDELKVAVSTGPSFVAGIGVGIALLIIKGMFAPFLFGLKWVFYNFFLKESSPWDLMKMFFLSHAPSEPWQSAVPPPSIENYRPPPMHNPYDNHGPPMRGPRPPPPRHHHGHYPFHPPYRGPKGYGPPPPPHYGSPTMPVPSHYMDSMDMEYSPPPPPPHYDLKNQFTHPTPMITTLGGVSPTMSQLEQLYRQQLLEEGLGLKAPYQALLPPDPTNSLDPMMGTDGPTTMEAMDMGMETDAPEMQSYIPSTGLQAEVEHFDPFYSPLLSKIDSIFTHLGHSDESCRERVVCSIYKFPVKYAPYSNLLSAQLSKHQSELKRPVSSSAKILRYFRYMKAAKDGQGGENCADLYPKCESDTDSVSSLPMITTFHQLSELMTAEGSSPGMALAAAAAAG